MIGIKPFPLVSASRQATALWHHADLFDKASRVPKIKCAFHWSAALPLMIQIEFDHDLMITECQGGRLVECQPFEDLGSTIISGVWIFIEWNCSGFKGSRFTWFLRKDGNPTCLLF